MSTAKGPATTNLDKFLATLNGTVITIQTLASGTGGNAPTANEPKLHVIYEQHARTMEMTFPDRTAQYRIRLYNLSGRVLHETEVSNVGNYRLQLPANETGACILSITSASRNFTYHFNAM